MKEIKTVFLPTGATKSSVCIDTDTGAATLLIAEQDTTPNRLKELFDRARQEQERYTAAVETIRA